MVRLGHFHAVDHDRLDMRRLQLGEAVDVVFQHGDCGFVVTIPDDHAGAGTSRQVSCQDFGQDGFQGRKEMEVSSDLVANQTKCV